MAETARALESVTEVPGVPPTPRVAVVGAGYWGKNLVRSPRDLGALAAVCDRDPAVLHAVAERHPGTRITASGPFFLLGTVSTWATRQAFFLLLTYGAVYLLVVNLVTTRRALDRLVRFLLAIGGLVAFVGLLESAAGALGTIPLLSAWISPGRARGAFGNPDHFATWLGMLLALGTGFLIARQRRRSSRPAAGGSEEPLISMRVARHRDSLSRGDDPAILDLLLFFGVVVIGLTLAFTLSRAGVASAFLALAGLALVLRGQRIGRRGNLLVGAVGLGVLAFAASLARAGRHADAQSQIEIALRYDPADPAVHLAMAEALGQRGEAEQALEYHQSAVAAAERRARELAGQAPPARPRRAGVVPIEERRAQVLERLAREQFGPPCRRASRSRTPIASRSGASTWPRSSTGRPSRSWSSSPRRASPIPSPPSPLARPMTPSAPGRPR